MKKTAKTAQRKTTTTKSKPVKPKKAAAARESLPAWVPVYVWTRAGGRCEFLGCNTIVWKDLLTSHEYNQGKIAHIVAARENGPRGDPIESPRLAKNPSNLMLLCGPHHDLVDNKAHEKKYPVALLQNYKTRHEERIERLCAIAEQTKSVPIVLQVPIFKHADPLPAANVNHAITRNDRYPDADRRIVIDLLGMSARDHDEGFWREAQRCIVDTYTSRLSAHQSDGPVDHFSIFAVGPIPLLMAFGRHVGDKVAADVFNLHRDPKGWTWPMDGARIDWDRPTIPSVPAGTIDVALTLSITSRVPLKQVKSVVPKGTPVFRIQAKCPELDTLRHPEDLRVFVRQVRKVMEAIHRTDAKRVHVFAGIPVAAAVEFGRALLPKLHATLVLYDYHTAYGGFRRALEMGSIT